MLKKHEGPSGITAGAFVKNSELSARGWQLIVCS